MSSLETLGVFTPSHRALIRSWWRKVTVANPSARNFKDMRTPVVEKGVFGILLEDSIKYAHSSISYVDDYTNAECFGYIPTAIAKCGSFLKEQAMKTEGIFRISGNERRTRLLQAIFDTPESYGSQLDWRGYTVHDAATVMKRFLNVLPQPVITLEYYRKFKDATNAEYPNLDAKIDAVQRIIECLPIAHQYLLIYLLDLLSMFLAAQEYTRMDLRCLSTVFAPGILSHPNDAQSPAEHFASQKAIAFLIENQDRLSMPRAQSNNMSAKANKHTTVSTLSPSTALPLPMPMPPLISKKNTPTTSASHGMSNIYSNAAGSYSGIGLESIAAEPENSVQPTSASVFSSTATFTAGTLRRSKTVPSKRNKYGPYEPQQIVHVNRTSSHKTLREQRSLLMTTMKR